MISARAKNCTNQSELLKIEQPNKVISRFRSFLLHDAMQHLWFQEKAKSWQSPLCEL